MQIRQDYAKGAFIKVNELLWDALQLHKLPAHFPKVKEILGLLVFAHGNGFEGVEEKSESIEG